jgi:hypothetical protein
MKIIKNFYFWMIIAVFVWLVSIICISTIVNADNNLKKKDFEKKQGRSYLDLNCESTDKCLVIRNKALYTPKTKGEKNADRNNH